MNITDYILNDFKPLTTKNSVKEAYKLCKTYQLTHIPIVENRIYKGSISQTDILTIENKKEELANFVDIFDHFQTDGSHSIIELLKVFADNNTNIIPAIQDHNYVGYFELNDILEIFSQTPFLNSDGIILVIQKNSADYTMSEVAQIIESNKGNLLGCYTSNKSNDKIELTIKVSSQETNELIQTFRRYNYTIITEHQDDYYLEELKNRSEYLQKFLNT